MFRVKGSRRAAVRYPGWSAIVAGWCVIGACWVYGTRLLAAVEEGAPRPDPPRPEPAAADEPAEALPNWRAATWGGMQLWTDEYVYAGWHIQRHALTGHCRLIDDANVRQAWGSYHQCRDAFEKLRREKNLPPMQREIVLLLHGLGGHRGYLAELSTFLATEGQYTTINVAYASTRGTIEDHAGALERVIANLEQVDRIHFVGHSMGNLVIRRYLMNLPPDAATRGPRVGRFVMLGPPNRGAEFAERLQKWVGVSTVLGPGSKQLADARRTPEQLAIPQCEFAIVAGGRGDNRGLNPLIEGDDDFLVAVSETRLPGARDFMRVPIAHHSLATDPHVQRCVLTFLQHGYLVSEQARQPLPPDGSPP